MHRNYNVKLLHLETDHPTLAQLICFVLPLDDVISNWNSFSHHLSIGRSYSLSSNNPHQSCIELLKMWSETGSATWSSLLGALRHASLHKGAGKLYRLLQGMYICHHANDK